MKRKSKHWGGVARRGEQTITKPRHAAGKIFSQKAQLLSAQAYKQESDGRRAAYGQTAAVELCEDFIGAFAWESARDTGDPIGDVRDRYETIVMELRAVRPMQQDRKLSLSVLLRDDYGDDVAVKDLLLNLGKWIREYVYACIRGERDCFDWSLEGTRFSEALVSALSTEYVRDRQGLMRFLSAVFKRWEKIDQADSIHRQRLITQQHRGGPRVVAEYLQNIGAASGCTRVEHLESLQGKIKQYRSRDRKKALEKREETW